MEKIAFKMQQNAKAHWLYEWPMKKKVKWIVKRLLARGQRRLFRVWLKYAENLSDIEVVCICEPEVGETLSDEEGRSVSSLINCEEGKDEFSNCQVGNEMRSLEDLIDCQEDGSGNSYCHVRNNMRLAEYLTNCQGGRNGLSSCQVGNRKRLEEGIMYYHRSSDESSNCQVDRGKEMRLSESLTDSMVSSCQ
jgi:hypothetical protein